MAKKLSELNVAVEAKVQEIDSLKKSVCFSLFFLSFLFLFCFSTWTSQGAAKDEIMKNVTEMKKLREEAADIRKKIEMDRKLDINKVPFPLSPPSFPSSSLFPFPPFFSPPFPHISSPLIPQEKFDALMKGRFFFTPSFGLYGGVSGLYDLGPPGCAMKANTINLWRKHFIVSEGMLELDTTSVTPLNVLKFCFVFFCFFFFLVVFCLYLYLYFFFFDCIFSYISFTGLVVMLANLLTL